MKRNNTILSGMLTAVLLLAFSLAANAQPGEQMERFKEEKVSFFNEKLELSEAEAKAFWPVYEDLNNRTFKINEDEKSLLNYFMSNAEYMKEKEIDQSIGRYLELQQKRFELDSQYHDKFVDIIGKEKTLKMYALEREFRMHLLRKFRGPGDGTGRGQNRRFR